MILFRPPTDAQLEAFLAGQRALDYTYSAVGATSGQLPSGYTVDHARVELGHGAEVFQTAQAALRHWKHFQLGWLAARPADTPLQTGSVVAIDARIGGVSWLNASRIVYTVDDDGPVRRFGFAYGTLADHAETGEERFLVEWDRASNLVCYDILAFSRPRHPLARLGFPLVRRLQKRFARDSARAMQHYCQSSTRSDVTLPVSGSTCNSRF